MLSFDSIMRSFGVLAEAIENFKNAPPSAEGYEESLEEESAPGEAERSAATGIPAPAGRSAGPALSIGVSKAKAGAKGIIVLAVDGTVDSSTSEEFESRLEQFIAESPAHLVLDLTNMVYISSSGWGIIVKYMQRLGDSGGKLALAGMSSMILKIFGDLGFEPLMPHYGTLERALSEIVLSEKSVSAPTEGLELPAERSAPGAPAEPAGPASGGGDLASALLGKADIIPLEPLKPEKEAEKVIFIDFKHRTDVRENKDKRIKKMGWDEYGKKVSEAEKNPKHRKK